MSDSKSEYFYDIYYGIESLEKQFERTRSYIARMHGNSDRIKQVSYIILGFLDSYYSQLFVPFSERLLRECVPGSDIVKLTERYNLLAIGWDEVSLIVYQARTNYEDVLLFMPIIEEIKKQFDLPDELILPCVLGPFSITRFKYTQNFSVLSIPNLAAYNPWEWSIFWHEVAGIIAIKERELLQTLYAELKPMLPVAEADTTEKIWTFEWFKELCEDAVSFVSFGGPFISILHRILIRDKSGPEGDSTHPPMQIRLRVGRLLLQRFSIDASLPDFVEPADAEGERVEAAVVDQIIRLLKGRIPANSEWPLTRLIGQAMADYVDDPKSALKIREQCIKTLKQNALILQKTQVVPASLTPEELDNGSWSDENMLIRRRRNDLGELNNGDRIRAHRYTLLP